MARRAPNAVEAAAPQSERYPGFCPKSAGLGVFGTLDFGIGAELVHETRLFAASSVSRRWRRGIRYGAVGHALGGAGQAAHGVAKVVTLPLVDAVPLLRPMASWNVRGSDGLDRPSACAVAASSSTASTSLFSSNA